MTARTLDRVVQFDHRSRQFPIRALLDTTQPRSYTWACDAYLDQGSEGACVGFAWAHEGAARPVVVPWAGENRTALDLYRRAQRLDPWPGEDYSGTSVLAGAKAAKEMGLLAEYRWCFDLKDTLAAVSRKGPAVLGTNWFEGMWDTDADGFIHPTGDIVGGHAILIRGVNVRGRYVVLRNSWGRSWGRNGDARLSWDDLETLLHQQGEVCVPVTRTAATR